MAGEVSARMLRLAPVMARSIVMPLVMGPMSLSVSALTSIRVATDCPLPPAAATLTMASSVAVWPSLVVTVRRKT